VGNGCVGKFGQAKLLTLESEVAEVPELRTEVELNGVNFGDDQLINCGSRLDIDHA
jgi:hypothetical protein